MKFAATILTVIVCSLTGNYFTMRDLNRVKAIEQILIMIQIISSEIKFSKTPINRILEKLVEHSDFSQLSFLRECKAYLKTEKFPTAWKKSVLSSRMNQEDKVLLLSLGSNLGTSDVEGQLSNCELHKELFESSLLSAREKCSKFGKLYTTLGVLSGFLIAVIVV